MSKTEISEVLERGVEQVYPTREALKQALKKPAKLKFYWGIDPSAAYLHLGHAIAARKLEQLRQLGCQVILLVGNFTATIGDPTDKSAARKSLSLKQTEANAKSYLKLLSPVLGLKDKKNPVKVERNSSWWSKMQTGRFMEIAQLTTVQRLLERDMFQERLKAGRPIYAHEFVYPLLQGYDSVALGVDGEVGGNDQTFNMLMGRTLVKSLLDKEKFVIATKLLVDPSGKKMGKSEGNAVRLDAPPAEMFGSIMSWPDSIVSNAFELLTRVPLTEVRSWEKKMGPRDLKAKLAFEIVTVFHDAAAAQEAEAAFNRVFREKAAPEVIKEVKVTGKKISAIDLLVTTKLVGSKSEARRVIEQGGLRINGEVIQNTAAEIAVLSGMVVQKGKRNFIRIK